MQSPAGRVQAEAIRVKVFWYAYQRKLYAYLETLHAFHQSLYAYKEE